MPILGGSPLGLIGVESRPSQTGLSTFNGGRTRNVNVNLYNVGRETDKERMGQTNNTKGGIFSLFTGGNIVRPWPNISSTGALEEPRLGLAGDPAEKYGGFSRSTLHNNDVYDTSILNIIEKTANTYAALRPSDFAYLKNVGVFPNNRLMVARRFYGPMSDDIFIKGKQAMATMISWVTPGENFLELQYGEEWIDANADFTEVINNIAQDLLGKSVAGSISGMLNAVPLPGFTEGITRELLKKLGVYDEGSGKILPAGDPNLIKQAKRRKTIKYSEAGSGLKCVCSIKMICEYEQKFISGIDPTIAWQDIIANAVRFGTSPGNSYGLSSGFGKKIIAWTKDPGKIISEFSQYVKEAITTVKDEILKYFDEQIAAAETSGESEDGGDTSGEEDGNAEEIKALEEQKGLVSKAIDGIIGILGNSLKKTISKYLEEIKGIVYALSGMPSTPWHITVGNPLRPIFCSGDMFTTDVTLKLGPVLAFNDLPSSIIVEFTLQNARPWGMDEILAKFNTGHLRTVNVVADSSAVNPLESMGPNNYVYAATSGTAGTAGTSGNNVSNLSSAPTPNSGSPSNTQIAVTETGGVGTAGTSGTDGTVGQNATPETTTKENETQVVVNSDPNSKDPVVQGEKAQATTTQTESTSTTDPGNKASSESKLGYTYLIQKQGDTRWVKVTDKDDIIVVVKAGVTTDKNLTDEQIINSVKAGIENPADLGTEYDESPTTAEEEATDSYQQANTGL